MGGNSEVEGDEEAAAVNLGSELAVLIGALCWAPHSRHTHTQLHPGQATSGLLP